MWSKSTTRPPTRGARPGEGPDAHRSQRCGLCDLKDSIYIAGGEFQDERLMAAFWVVEAYHPVTNSWAILPRMPVPRHGLAGAALGNRVHFVTGEVQSAGIQGAHLASESHDAFEFADR